MRAITAKEYILGTFILFMQYIW